MDFDPSVAPVVELKLIYHLTYVQLSCQYFLAQPALQAIDFSTDLSEYIDTVERIPTSTSRQVSFFP